MDRNPFRIADEESTARPEAHVDGRDQHLRPDSYDLFVLTALQIKQVDAPAARVPHPQPVPVGCTYGGEWSVQRLRGLFADQQILDGLQSREVLTADVDALLDRVTDKTRILFLANPNNPTGSYIPADELQRLRDGLRDDVLLAIDSAYAEYVNRNDYTAGIEMVEKHDNVVMTRTFSKIYGLAALRLGWVYCPDAIADVLHRLRGPFNVNAAAQAAGVAALHDIAHTDNARAHNEEWREWVTRQFEQQN